MAACCPPNAEKYLAPDYTAIGRLVDVEGASFYETGTPASKKAIVLIPDIFGWNGGRTRNLADFFAGEGYFVVVPKLLSPPPDGKGTDGDGFLELDFSQFKQQLSKYPFHSDSAADYPLAPKIFSVFEYLKRSGIEKVGLLGFCWGGWVTTHILTTPYGELVTSQVIPHPSITLENGVFEKDTLLLVERINKPTLFFPTKGDPDEYREGGAFINAVTAHAPGSKTIDLSHVNHGFAPRGDFNDPVNGKAIKEAVDLVLAETVAFFAKFL